MVLPLVKEDTSNISTSCFICCWTAGLLRPGDVGKDVNQSFPISHQGIYLINMFMWVSTNYYWLPTLRSVEEVWMQTYRNDRKDDLQTWLNKVNSNFQHQGLSQKEAQCWLSKKNICNGFFVRLFSCFHKKRIQRRWVWIVSCLWPSWGTGIMRAVNGTFFIFKWSTNWFSNVKTLLSNTYLVLSVRVLKGSLLKSFINNTFD